MSNDNSHIQGLILDYLVPLGHDFERFGRYVAMFTHSSSLKHAAEGFYREVMNFLGYSISVLQTSKPLWYSREIAPAN